MPPRAAAVDTTTGVNNNSNDDLLKVLKCDYLIVGAGTSGMSFVDTMLTENPKATIVIVDRNSQPGGHWTTAYPWVTLHQPSCNYGINSMQLGKTKKRGYERYDVKDLATGTQILEYYGEALKKFEATGRVQSFFDASYVFDEATGNHTIVSSSNNTIQVDCRKVVTVKSNVTVPSMREPLIPVDPQVNFIPVNNIPESLQSGKFQNYIVFGNGKTGCDAVVHLINSGVDPSQISWVSPRDVWYFNRDGLADFYKAMDVFRKLADADSIEEAYLSFEKGGLLHRIDPTRPFPMVFKGPVMTTEEMEQMRSVKNIVRMGRATSIEAGRVVLQEGTLDFTNEDTLLVDCMVNNLYGYDFDKDFTIFEPGRINLGPLTSLFNVSMSAAHLAFLETKLEDDDSKNKSCYFLRGKEYTNGHPSFLIGSIYMEMKSTEVIMKIKGGAKFYMNSRCNGNAPKHFKGGWWKFLWMSFGPKQMAKFGKVLVKKIESKGYSDIDHCWGVETFPQAKIVAA